MKVIEVTSASPSEGKTTTVANLAVALVQAGHRVAVVSADLRRPELHNRFGESLSPGLTDVLIGEAQLSSAMRATPSGVYLLAGGAHAPNPSELLGSSRTEVVLEFLSSEFDFVLVDSTPVLSVTDATVMSRFVDATVVVVAAKSSSGARVQKPWRCSIGPTHQ